MFIVKCYLSFVYIVCSYHPNSNGNLLFPEKFCEVSENFFFTQKQSEASCSYIFYILLRALPRAVNCSTCAMNGVLQLRETWVRWIARLLAPLTVKRFTDCVAQVDVLFFLT